MPVHEISISCSRKRKGEPQYVTVHSGDELRRKLEVMGRPPYARWTCYGTVAAFGAFGVKLELTQGSREAIGRFEVPSYGIPEYDFHVILNQVYSPDGEYVPFSMLSRNAKTHSPSGHLPRPASSVRQRS